MLNKISAVIFLSLSVCVFAGCELGSCSGDFSSPENYKIVNSSGQSLIIALKDGYGVFPDSLVLPNSESFQWTPPLCAGEPFDIKQRKCNIYFNSVILIKGRDFPDDRNISIQSSYEPAGEILTFTFTEADYLYALKHGTPVGPA